MNIRTVTVLGANGTMGRNVSAIFASFGKAKVNMICRTIDKANQAVEQAVNSVRAESIRYRLIPKTYDDLESCIQESDLIFESLSEDINVKKNIYNQIKRNIKKDAIIATGTSGLSIKELSQSFGEISDRFFGIHMFNPPYILTLCELILHDEKQEDLAKELKKYLSNQLNRTVVKVKDSPSFLGNRIGFFFINEAMQLAKINQDQGGIDYIDAILGSFTGRNMAPLVTSDFVGLDVHKSIVDYIYEKCSDQFIKSFEVPEYLNELIKEKKLGRKVNCGLYYKDRDNNQLYVYDIKSHSYRLKNNYQFYFSNEMIKHIQIGDYQSAISILLNDESHEAILCKEMLLKYIVYSLKISYEVSYDIKYCDNAMATGFSWLPPLAMIDLLGGINTVRILVEKYLDENYVLIINNQNILELLPENSKYDYRPFLKAKY